MSTREIELKIKELRNIERLIEEAQAEAETIKDQIKAIMGESEELRAGEYKVTWKTVTSTRIDTTAIKKELPEIAARYSKQSKTRRFLIA